VNWTRDDCYMPDDSSAVDRITLSESQNQDYTQSVVAVCGIT